MKTLILFGALALAAPAHAAVTKIAVEVSTAPAAFAVGLTTSTCTMVATHSGAAASTVTISDKTGSAVWSQTLSPGFPMYDVVMLRGAAAGPFTIQGTAAGVKLSARCQSSP